MNSREAVRYLHERHPRVIPAPEGEVDLGALHFEVFTLQMHACELVDRRADRAARRCFETVHELLVRGDADVRPSVWNDFAIPHLVHHPDLAWAKGRMPPLLAEMCDKVRETIWEMLDGDPPAPADRQG